MDAMGSDVCAGKCATSPSPSESSCTLICKMHEQKQNNMRYMSTFEECFIYQANILQNQYPHVQHHEYL